MEYLFDKLSAEKLSGSILDEARAYLLCSLCEATGISLELCGDAKTIFSTYVCTREPQVSPYTLTWEGVIASSDYRDDGVLIFGAHLFPMIGGVRTCLWRKDGGLHRYDYAFRYLLLTREEGWSDLGWQLDEYSEFSDWYC